MLALGLFVTAMALSCGVFALLAAPVARLPIDRRTVGDESEGSLLAQVSDGLTEVVDRVLRRRGWVPFSAQEIELAGLTVSQSSLVLTVASLSVTALVLGLIVFQSLFFGVVLACFLPLGTKAVLRVRASRRRAAFAAQLDASLQMLSSALRAGHSFPRAMDAVSREAAPPMGEVLARIVNENRLGRDLVDGMRKTSERLQSEDFGWVADAVSIQRDTGGNLSEILDRVGATIRERNEIRAQIHALSAEGRISAIILMALPVTVGAAYTLMNPTYMAPLFFSTAGRLLLGVSAVLYVVAALWLRALVNVKF